MDDFQSKENINFIQNCEQNNDIIESEQELTPKDSAMLHEKARQESEEKLDAKAHDKEKPCEEIVSWKAEHEEHGGGKNGNEYESLELLQDTTENNVKTIQKEAIEILNVELVVPGRSDIDAESEKQELTGKSNVEEEKQSSIPRTEILLYAAPNDISIENNSEDNESEMNALNVQSMKVAEKQDLNNSLNENNRNNTEPLNAVLTSGLSLLAQYQSDDDTDSVIEVPIAPSQDYRNQVVEIDSDSDSSDSSDSSDIEFKELRKTIEKRIEVAVEDDDDDIIEGNNGKKKHQQKLKVRGELLLEDLPPIQDLKITVPEDDCIELGKIHSVVDQLVLVSVLPNSILLDLETIIFLEKGKKVLGEVFDVLGQVADPLYCVRFNSNNQIKEKCINIGDIVYIAPKTQYTQYVILSNLMKTKGSDASWENDLEPPPRFLEYSDDEQEQLAKRELRNKDRPTDNVDQSKRPRTEDDDSASNNSVCNPNTHYRDRNEQKHNRGRPAGYSNVNIRHNYNGSSSNQQRVPNHHRSSWHSNYYPQSFQTHPSGIYGAHTRQNRPPSSQAYSPRMPVYTPPPHAMSYPLPPQPAPYGAPTMFHPHPPPIMPNTFSIRSQTLHGHPPSFSNNHPITPPPPPPGIQ